MTRKRYVKLLMSYGYSRNVANRRANRIRGSYKNDMHGITLRWLAEKVFTGDILISAIKQLKEETI